MRWECFASFFFNLLQTKIILLWIIYAFNFFSIENVISNQKEILEEIKMYIWKKEKKGDCFISQKRKKSYSGNDQMSKNWYMIDYQTCFANKFGMLKIGVADYLAQDRNPTKTFETQNISSRCSSSSVGKIQIFFYHFLVCLSLWKMAT